SLVPPVEGQLDCGVARSTTIRIPESFGPLKVDLSPALSLDRQNGDYGCPIAQKRNGILDPVTRRRDFG
ncbi:hypothetical protein AB0M50_22305, partial [Nonomuraea fuscirosea]|uniref:hypothetical protein n=1 Tax=Nonomuraea fuscirosea TaxID=1291556 RepID=UPI0034307947